MKRRANLLLILAAILIATAPLMFSRAEKPEGFTGTDDAALGVVERQAPGYVAWIDPLMEPGDGAETALFVVQAGIGFGFIGYYFWYARGRRSRVPGAPTTADTAPEREAAE